MAAARETDVDEILSFLHAWLTRRRSPSDSPLYPELATSRELDAIVPAVERELGTLLERQRVALGEEAVDQWLARREGAIGTIEKEVAAWVSGSQAAALPDFKKAVAFVQLLSRERGFESVGKVDGRYGPKTREILPSLAVYELRLIEIVQKWLIGNSHALRSELGELGPKTIRALREELANDERVPEEWRPERRLVAFGQLLCRKYGFEEVGSIDGWLGPSTRSALGLLAERLARGPRIGLALSGGGFRASIFHLGVIRRLEELGIMSRVDVISSVSGGSIIAAYYVIEMERRLDLRPPPPPDDPSYARYLELERRERLKVFEDIAADFFARHRSQPAHSGAAVRAVLPSAGRPQAAAAGLHARRSVPGRVRPLVLPGQHPGRAAARLPPGGSRTRSRAPGRSW